MRNSLGFLVLHVPHVPVHTFPECPTYYMYFTKAVSFHVGKKQAKSKAAEQDLKPIRTCAVPTRFV